jgi:transposase
LPRCVTGGVDTHLDVHVAAALDQRGTLLSVESFATTAEGYKKLPAWLSDFGPVELVGVEGTGSYGAGLTRHLQADRVKVVEVDRPNRRAGGARASRTLKTPSPLPTRRNQATPWVKPRRVTETSNPCGFYAWRGHRRAAAGRERSTRCGA